MPNGRNHVLADTEFGNSTLVGKRGTRHHSVDALTGVLFLASAVFVMRVVGTTIDGAWREAYTKTAIPVEALFVIVVAVIRIIR